MAEYCHSDGSTLPPWWQYTAKRLGRGCGIALFENLNLFRMIKKVKLGIIPI